MGGADGVGVGMRLGLREGVRRAAVGLMALGLVGASWAGAGAAYAEGRRHDRYHRDHDGECQSGGCRNDQSRHPGHDDNHKSFSPDLKDSPVTVCMPGSTCNFDQDGHKKDGEGEGQGDGQGNGQGGGQGENPQPGETPR